MSQEADRAKATPHKEVNKWLSCVELEEYIKTLPETSRLFKLYALSIFVRRAFYAKDFHPTSAWTDCIQLTDYAKTYIAQVRKEGIGIEDREAAFIFFRFFSYHDLFIDYLHSDIDGVFELLNLMHKNGTAKWPYIFGKLLYEKFNIAGSVNRTDHLDPPEAEVLLQDTPQGVFQMGQVVSGPLGFFESCESRRTPPTRDVLLWHCSDPGCQKEHLVELRTFKSPIEEKKLLVARHIFDLYGPESEWDIAIRVLMNRDEESPEGKPYADLPAVIGDCILGNERTRLLLQCFRSSHYGLLTKCLKESGKKLGDPATIVQHLTPEEQHQLLLLTPDRDLVQYIDTLIAAKDIRIPPAELRTIKTPVITVSRYKHSLLSSLGIIII